MVMMTKMFWLRWFTTTAKTMMTTVAKATVEDGEDYGDGDHGGSEDVGI